MEQVFAGRDKVAVVLYSDEHAMLAAELDALTERIRLPGIHIIPRGSCTRDITPTLISHLGIGKDTDNGSTQLRGYDHPVLDDLHAGISRGFILRSEIVSDSGAADADAGFKG